MSIEESKALLKQRKSESIDSFGLSKKELNSEEQSQVTPYDSFYLEDSLRILHNYDILNDIKAKISSRLDEKTGLYSVTVGDANSEYYDFATMFNRMSNLVYSQKVWRSVKLLKEILKNMQKDYFQGIDKAISQHSFDETMNHIENKHL